MSFNNYDRDTHFKIETAQFKQWAISSMDPRTRDIYTSKLVAAFFRDLDTEYLPYSQQTKTVHFYVPASWWEHLKSTLLRQLPNDLKFGWLADYRIKTRCEKRVVEYTTKITLRSYTVHVTDSRAGDEICRASFDSSRISPQMWYEVQSD